MHSENGGDHSIIVDPKRDEKSLTRLARTSTEYVRCIC
jgi:hypothetical protein